MVDLVKKIIYQDSKPLTCLNTLCKCIILKMTENNESALKTDERSQTINEGTPYYMEVIWDKDLHPYPQPPLPKENPTISEQEPSTSSDGKPILPERKRNVGKGTSNIKEGSCIHNILPAIPEHVEGEVAQNENTTYASFDELWDLPMPEYPKIKRELRFQINWNPLGLRRKTICCLVIFATAIASIIGMTIVIFLLTAKLNEGKIPDDR